jgi:inosine-uridine nucleoside N-ribohydrolase
VTVLGTGSPTNLYGAQLQDERFFALAERFVLMGGVTHPLFLGNQAMDELNLSSDPQAAFQVIRSGAELTMITGHLCLEAMMDADRINRVFSTGGSSLRRIFLRPVMEWQTYIRRKYGVDGFPVWDAVAAVYLTSPELFEDRMVGIVSTEEDLARGLLLSDEPPTPPVVHLPVRIKNTALFWEVLQEAWLEADRIIGRA